MSRWYLRLVFVFLLAATVALAQGKGGGGGGGGNGGGGNGGGGNQPPPDPAIAYVNGDLLVMDDDGSNATRVLAAGGQESVRAPSWSPGNTHFAVSGTLGGAFGVHVVAADGSGAYLAVPIVGQCMLPWPDWSPVPTPDGHHKIAFTVWCAPSDYSDVWVANPDGTGVVNLTNTPGSLELYPTFSRDGTRIAFVRDFGELVVAELGVVSGALAITSEYVAYASGSLAFPEWARTQDLIAVGEMRDQLMRIVILDPFAAPAVPIVLTPGSSGDERWPSFSPDDAQIVFHRNGSGPSGGIFTIGVDGTGETRISSKGHDPVWRR